jgi:amino acid transporter
VPIVAFLILGLTHLQPKLLHPFWPDHPHDFAQAIFIAVFACSGFEYVSLPAGDAGSARTDIPRAILGALAGSTVLYVLVQLAVVGSTPHLEGSLRPLAEASEHMVGPWGASAIGVASLVSMAGFCASSALVGPRLFCAFADDRLLPQVVALRHGRWGTPVLAIVLSCGISAVAAASLDFDRLVDISNVALFAQYLPTCLAVMVLRRTHPKQPRAYRLPWGDTLPLLAVAASVAMLVVARPARPELVWSAGILGVGMVLYFIRRLLAPAEGARVG